MSLKDKALEAYKKDIEEKKKVYEEDCERFADIALGELQKIIRTEHSDIRITDKSLSSTKFLVDNELIFEVSLQSGGSYIVNMLKQCPICKYWIKVKVLTLADVGEFISMKHEKRICDRLHVEVEISHLGKNIHDKLEKRKDQ